MRMGGKKTLQSPKSKSPFPLYTAAAWWERDSTRRVNLGDLEEEKEEKEEEEGIFCERSSRSAERN